jgi:hypothetical protein
LASDVADELKPHSSVNQDRQTFELSSSGLMNLKVPTNILHFPVVIQKKEITGRVRDLGEGGHGAGV